MKKREIRVKVCLLIAALLAAFFAFGACGNEIKTDLKGNGSESFSEASTPSDQTALPLTETGATSSCGVSLSEWKGSESFQGYMVSFPKVSKKTDFFCKAYGGSFVEEGVSVKKTTVREGNSLCWQADDEMTETAYIGVVMRKNGKIEGIAVVRIAEKNSEYSAVVITDYLFSSGAPSFLSVTLAFKVMDTYVDRIKESELENETRGDLNASPIDILLEEIKKHETMTVEIDGVKITVDLVELNRNFEYTLENDEISISAYKGSSKKVRVPDGVRKIERDAFKGAKIEELSLPQSLREIGEGAFSSITTLKKAEAPLAAILAFGAQPSLKELCITDGMGSAEMGLIDFSEYPQLENLRTYVAIEAGCFKDHKNLKRVYFERQTEVGAHAFENCSALESVSPSGALIRIGEAAFKNCSALKNALAAKQIEKNAFENCVSIDSWIENEPIEKIGKEAFKGCSSLFIVLFLGGVSVIEERAFFGCSALVHIRLKETQRIEREAFAETRVCVSELQATLAFLGENVFDYEGLETIRFEGTPEQWDAIEKENFVKSGMPQPKIECVDGYVAGDEMFRYETKADGSLAIVDFLYKEEARGRLIVPSRSPFSGRLITEIKTGALVGINHVDELVLSEGITSIGETAIRGMNLMQVTIPSTVTKVGIAPFCGSEKLIRLINRSSLPLDVLSLLSDVSTEELRKQAEDNRKILGRTGFVETVRDEAFFKYKMKWDERGICLLQDGEDEWLMGCRSEESLLDLSDYSFNKMFRLAFAYLDKTETVILPGTSSVSESAFYSAYSVKKIILSEGVRWIRRGAFQYCEELKEVVIPDSVTKIEAISFYCCKELETIYLGKGISKIESDLISGPEHIRIVFNGSETAWHFILFKNPWILLYQNALTVEFAE